MMMLWVVEDFMRRMWSRSSVAWIVSFLIIQSYKHIFGGVEVESGRFEVSCMVKTVSGAWPTSVLVYGAP
jgi:hypothetical protein